MLDETHAWKVRIAAALNTLAGGGGEPVTPEDIAASAPPRPELGDAAFALFPFAKTLRRPPAQIAAQVCALLMEDGGVGQGDAPAVTADGGYLNVRFDRRALTAAVLEAVFTGESALPLKGQNIMLEFSSPNTNKPLHLGHVRNDALGMSIARILASCGANVKKVCIINDRGIHICKSMLAYMDEGGGGTPEAAGVKSDHFVGDWYVRFSARLAAEKAALEAAGTPADRTEAASTLLARARELLVKWEEGEEAVVELWRRMNGWAIAGMRETYRRTGVSFDTYYYESETYRLGRDEVLKGLDAGVFYRAEDGAVWADLSAEKLDKKVLLRKDGTSLYITQDFGTAIARHKDFPFDQMIYVVGNEQRYHFQVLFTLLAKLRFAWAADLRHLAYGMVNLPEGRMKTREGTVVDADALLDSLHAMAVEEIQAKEREELVGDIHETAEKIALGALHYYLLQTSPERDMLFNPKESLSFNGNTGPYLQYMGARISSLLKKAGAAGAGMGGGGGLAELAVNDLEWELVKTMARWNEQLAQAAEKCAPSIIAGWVYELAKNFSRFYHDCPVLNADCPRQKQFRLTLCEATLTLLRRALDLICVPFLECM